MPVLPKLLEVFRVALAVGIKAEQKWRSRFHHAVAHRLGISLATFAQQQLRGDFLRQIAQTCFVLSLLPSSHNRNST